MVLILRQSDNGLFCEAGNFHVDPWEPVDRAVITHAHSDHARWGSKRYLVARDGERVLRQRLSADPDARFAPKIESVEYGQPVFLNGVRVSLHPAGHILGSAQVRIEHRGEVWVVSGDYKLQSDPTCAPFEPLRCHTFVTESTFGLPIYRWPSSENVLASVADWWRANREAGKASLLLTYSLGKAQRLLAGLANRMEGAAIYTHGAVEAPTEIYRQQGVPLANTVHVAAAPPDTVWSTALILAPPSCRGTPWTRRFEPFSSGFASGWMRIRGTRRRLSLDRGFVFSDHADWSGLNEAIEATGAESVWVTHGYRTPLVRWLREKGRDARAVETRFEGEAES
ncbi:MAG: ligase-associated DNA damage response exonuclease [Bryobacteraceae bacterium]